MNKKSDERAVAATDAIALLKADHRRVKQLFAQFQALGEGDDGAKARLVAQVCEELTVHTALEEEIFYPALRDALDEGDPVDEALVEHAGAKALVAQLRSATPDDYLYDAKVTVLGEQIDHHVTEEEGSLFPRALHAGLDLDVLGRRMQQRREALLAVPASLRAREVEGLPAEEVAEAQARPPRTALGSRPAANPRSRPARNSKKATRTVARKK